MTDAEKCPDLLALIKSDRLPDETMKETIARAFDAARSRPKSETDTKFPLLRRSSSPPSTMATVVDLAAYRTRKSKLDS
jgi:hypothetical protein